MFEHAFFFWELAENLPLVNIKSTFSRGLLFVYLILFFSRKAIYKPHKSTQACREEDFSHHPMMGKN